MNQQLVSFVIGYISRLKQTLSQGLRGYKELKIASGIAICLLLLRSLGLLQSLELAALDQFFRLRLPEAPEERITIVGIDEESLRRVGVWPIPDEVIADLLHKLKEHQPRAIGLDIYRDLPVSSGYPELVKAYNSIPNLITVELLAKNKNARVLAPQLSNKRDKVGFDNILYDPDGKVRRSLLYWHVENEVHESFALKLALLYLKSANIQPKKAADNSQYLQLNKAIFTRFESNSGAYVGADAKGYQILSNFPKPGCRNVSKQFCPYRYVSLQDVLSNQIEDSWIRNRIVLIGFTTPSVQDFVFIPYSSSLVGTAKPISGVELQGYFVHELIAAALDGRPLLKVWSDPLEWLWIFGWSYLGAVVVWRIRQHRMSILMLMGCVMILILMTYVAFLFGLWIPIIPALLTLSSSAIVMTSYIAYMQEEFKRSTEFLHQVLNTIPDPVFVKNAQYRSIVLNEAYCQFIGYTNDLLIEKSDYELFPKHEADVFRQQDELVFRTQQPQEHEEEFTGADGKTHLIATKRSLHKDAAGNFFLVGVIRDITQRKQLEEELKRTAADLYKYNYELKRQEDQLRHIAYHDPLTGLSNRQFFLETLYESLAWAEKHQMLLGLLFIDLDGFKQVNDTLGHEMGDRLLVIIAQRLNNSLRASDTVSRLGGDEFTVILRAISNVQIASKVAEKLLNVITEPIILDGYTTKVSASIGISLYPINSLESEGLIKQADRAMYRAKRLGKNRYEFA
ncbi:MAG TPA: CHASE2 domain-containing protein [Nostocaceae cyanobacterium]|nr:CHASE2 domain-containing protein [Nostocaceae cyanobacterium]